jgi:hypothetical protein
MAMVPYGGPVGSWPGGSDSQRRAAVGPAVVGLPCPG